MVVLKLMDNVFDIFLQNYRSWIIYVPITRNLDICSSRRHMIVNGFDTSRTMHTHLTEYRFLLEKGVEAHVKSYLIC